MRNDDLTAARLREPEESQAKADVEVEAGPLTEAPGADEERPVQTAEAELVSRRAGGRTPAATSEHGRDQAGRAAATPSPNASPAKRTFLSPEERADDSFKSFQLGIRAWRELCIRRRQIVPEVGNKLEQAWAAEGPVPSSHLHCVREEK